MRLVRTDLVFDEASFEPPDSIENSRSYGFVSVCVPYDQSHPLSNIRPHLFESRGLNPDRFGYSEEIARLLFESFVSDPLLDSEEVQHKVISYCILAKALRTNTIGKKELKTIIDSNNHSGSALEYVLASNVVVERSPPQWINLNELLKFGPTVGGGMVIGLVASSYPIVLVTVPMGIILMGSAIGISKAFESGLPRMIQQRLFSRRGRDR